MCEIEQSSVDLHQKVSGFEEDWDSKECSSSQEKNALNRVVNLPVVMSTWNALHSYYTNMKNSYPTISPYLETAENMTSTVANIAIATSRPVVGKLAPTVNSYANLGLDKLEDKVPMIRKEPEEIYQQTKSTATSMLTSRVNRALSTTEEYVDYYLPSDESDNESSDEDSNSDDEYEDEFEDLKNPRERIRDISNKVRRRSYKRAMAKWNGVQTRSKEALEKLHFTVDLIQYAHNGMNSKNVLTSAGETIHSAADSINKQVEKRVLSRATNFARQLNGSCASAVQYIQSSSRLQHLLERAKKAKETTEDLYTTFANKKALTDLSHSLIESTRPKLAFVEETLLQILEHIAEQPPIAWLTPDFDIDPLGGVEMEEIEVQLYGRPRDEDDIEGRPTSPLRKQG